MRQVRRFFTSPFLISPLCRPKCNPEKLSYPENLKKKLHSVYLLALLECPGALRNLVKSAESLSQFISFMHYFRILIFPIEWSQDWYFAMSIKASDFAGSGVKFTTLNLNATVMYYTTTCVVKEFEQDKL